LQTYRHDGVFIRARDIGIDDLLSVQPKAATLLARQLELRFRLLWAVELGIGVVYRPIVKAHPQVYVVAIGLPDRGGFPRDRAILARVGFIESEFLLRRIFVVQAIAAAIIKGPTTAQRCISPCACIRLSETSLFNVSSRSRPRGVLGLWEIDCA